MRWRLGELVVWEIEGMGADVSGGKWVFIKYLS